MSRITLICLSICLAIVQAGFLDKAVRGTTTDYADFFANQFSGVKDLIPGNQAELLTNANRVKDLLTAVKSKSRLLEPMANDAQKSSLSKVGGMLQEVTSFAGRVSRDGEGRFNVNKALFQTLIGKVFTSGGMMQLLPLLTGSSASLSIASAVLVPLTFMLFRH